MAKTVWDSYVELKEKLVELLKKARVTYYTAQFNSDYYDYVAGRLIADGVTVQEWISVKDRLPEPMEWVLCACRANIIEVLRYDHIMDDWDTTMPNRCYMKGFVTHWMPLPQPPKGE